MRYKLFLFLTTTASIFISCNENKSIIFCTEEFRTVGINIFGSTLDDYFTIRTATNDTLTFQDLSISNYYVVLDDSFQPELENKRETFEFIGLINDSVVIQETYIIEADECHINKVSGATEITL